MGFILIEKQRRGVSNLMGNDIISIRDRCMTIGKDVPLRNEYVNVYKDNVSGEIALEGTHDEKTGYKLRDRPQDKRRSIAIGSATKKFLRGMNGLYKFNLVRGLVVLTPVDKEEDFIYAQGK